MAAIVIYLTDETPAADFVEAAKELREFILNGATFTYAKHILLYPTAEATDEILAKAKQVTE